ncbi:DUF2213 domain-containing protein [Microcoleus sp. Pol12B5]|uniref:DUF2213 domain-containing protein n=1 Tax=Microcoleus sp. Pol12B5 TaxID=3055396 RepID=UPI002FD54E00
MSTTLEKTDWEYRADSGKLGEWQLTPEGYLVANAKIARIGIQEYPNPDGTVRREFRPPEEVANRDSLKTLCDLPISIEHPPAMLDSSNARQFAVGWNGSVSYDGGFVSTKVKLIDQHAVKNALDGGRIELSVGYMTKLDWTPGTWEGQRYDAIQRNIKGNHIALTVKARGGADLRLYPGLASPELHKDSEILEKCWQISEPRWTDSDVRLDNLHIKVGGENDMKMYESDDLQKMSKDELIDLVTEMQSGMAEKEEELSETKDSAVYWQGRATAYEDSLSVESDLSRSDSDNATNRRVKEKEIRIAELEGRLDSSERENTAIRRQFDEAKSKIQRLDSDLQLTRDSQEKAITTQRESWVKTWNEAFPFLPKVAQAEPDYTLDSVGIMRLALQNSRPTLNLDSLVQSASNPDDVIRTAFSVMVAEGLAKPTAERGFMAQLIDQAKTDSGNYSLDSIGKIRQEQNLKKQEAWKVTN